MNIFLSLNHLLFYIPFMAAHASNTNSSLLYRGGGDVIIVSIIFVWGKHMQVLIIIIIMLCPRACMLIGFGGMPMEVGASSAMMNRTQKTQTAVSLMKMPTSWEVADS
jgi:hypothetical protein